MADEQEKYPIDKRFRVKNKDIEEKFKHLQEALEDHEETRKYSDQATMELAVKLADLKLQEIEKEKQKLRTTLP